MDLQECSGILSDPFLDASAARGGISEPRERFANMEIATPVREAKGGPGKAYSG